MDKEAVKKFYFSGASKYSSFPCNKSQNSNTTVNTISTTTDDASLNDVNVDISDVEEEVDDSDSAAEHSTNKKEDTMINTRIAATNHSLSTARDHRPNSISSIARSAIGNSMSSSTVTPPAGHLNAIRSIAQQNLLTSIVYSKNETDTSGDRKGNASYSMGHSSVIRQVNRNGSRKGKVSNTVPPDAASPEYFAFLRQQQELSKSHIRIDKAIKLLEESRRDHQEGIEKTRRSCLEILHDIETNSDWKLHSKYDVCQLMRDCDLSLQSMELMPDIEPDTSAVAAIDMHLTNMKKQYKDSPAFAPYSVMVEQALRRVELLQSSLKEGNCDFTSLARIPDTLLVQLENNCELLSIEDLIRDNEVNIAIHSVNVENMRDKRKEALEDGEVNIAEKLCYDIIDKYESLVGEVICKARTLDKAFEDTVVITEVQEEHHKYTAIPLENIRSLQSKLRTRCEGDIKKMLTLRGKVEGVEAVTRAKVSRDREASDKVLSSNEERLVAVFHRMTELENELEILEKERNREFQRRLVEKDKDEHRRAEYAKFCDTVDDHLIPLERTIRNTDIMTKGTDVVQDVVDDGFNNVADELSDRSQLLKDTRVETHKEHAEVFRALLVELGEIIYRKERMIEEVDKKIQQAHIQQELLAETFNPKARKFGDMKKSLVASRDELEEDVRHLKSRAENALIGFQYSEEALHEAGIDFIHPVTDQEHHTLAMKAKMIEYKAIMAGHYKGSSVLMEEIVGLQQDVTCAREAMNTFNTSTIGIVNRSLPRIRDGDSVGLGI